MTEGAADAVITELGPSERAIVARVVADVGLLLGGEPFGMELPAGAGGPVDDDDPLSFLSGLESSLAEPDDPAVLRLLPNAVPSDREAADEFRRLTEGELRRLKVGRLRLLWDSLGADGEDWVVPAEHIMDAAAALADVRLVLASRLGLETEADAEAFAEEVAEGNLDPERPREERERVWLGMLYHLLAWMQESLMERMGNDE